MLQEVSGCVSVTVESTVRITALIESIFEDLPTEGALAADEDPGHLPEASGGHVSPPDGECSPVADCDVSLTASPHIDTHFEGL